MVVLSVLPLNLWDISYILTRPVTKKRVIRGTVVRDRSKMIGFSSQGRRPVKPRHTFCLSFDTFTVEFGGASPGFVRKGKNQKP